MRSARGRLMVCILLFIAAGCSKAPSIKSTNYRWEGTCSGGGGLETCVLRNTGDDRIGPFDLEANFLDEHSMVIGSTVVRNDRGLEPKDEWRFTVSGSGRARSIRLGPLTPR